MTLIDLNPGETATINGISGIKYQYQLYNTNIVNNIVIHCPIKCNNLVFGCLCKVK